MTEVSFEEFSKIEIKIGRIVEAERLTGSNRLLKLKVDIGGETRQSIAGLAEYYKPEDLKGRLAAAVVNLKPRKVFGEASEVMLLAAIDGGNISLLKPDRDVSAGSKVA